ncbi:MAG: LacI family DNA-binding transcriptional regulator [Selenomonadaceae bacterium]|nr:LacI family DNA-binding transcriptional regulator [Selenomonadaceae bacterium]
MERKTTIKDVAQLAQVSKSTVSRYLNDGYVSSEKAERIKKAVKELDFKGNFFAKRLKTKHCQLIGLVLPRMDSVSVGKLLMGINAVFEPKGYQAIILVSQLNGEKELNNILSLHQQGVDGIIVNSVGLTAAHARLRQEISTPLVFTGQKRPGLICLKNDDEAAGRMMGAYLKECGHRRAVFAGVTETDSAVGLERKRGFIDAFTADNPGATVNFVETGFDFLGAYNKGAEICALNPTVIVGATDNIALGVLRYLHEQNIKVPDEVSVAGFGGYEVGAVVYPALTSIAFDYELMGMKAAHLLLDMIHDQNSLTGDTLPIFFLERESVLDLTKPFAPKQPEKFTTLT